jgi:hypothetical protein
MVRWLFFCFWAMTWTAAAQNVTAQISGRVADSAGGAIPGAEVRLVSSQLRREVAKTKTDARGSFTLQALPSVNYLLSVWSPGFRAQQVNVLMPGGDRKEMGTLSLSILSCDAPDLLCDTFGLGPVGPPSYKRGH